MKSFAKSIFPLIALLLLLSSITAIAEEKKAPSQDEMMAVYMKYATPGPDHKLLEPLIGSWNVNTRFWMDPSTPGDTSSGTSECKWILGGRFVSEEVAGTMSGMPFHGMGITGYDNYGQKFFNIWLDEMSTTYMICSGQADSTGNVITFTGTYEDYMTGQKAQPFRSVTRILSNDKHIYEMYFPGPDGKEFLSYEGTYIRKK
jgi:hypothetical protein